MKKLATLSILLASLVNVNAQVLEAMAISSVATPIASNIVSDASVSESLVPDMSLSLLSVSVSVGYESKYVFRGEQLADQSIQSKVEFAYPVYGFDVYVGAWANTPIEQSTGTNEIDMYAGVNYFYKSLSVDLGYVYYYYPDAKAGERSGDMEVYVGVSFDTSAYLGNVNVNPSAYYYYNWDLDQHVAEVSLSYEAPIGSWLISNSKITLPVSVYGGYLTAGKKDGNSAEVTYFYWGVSADLAIKLTDYCSISGGARFSMRDEDGDSTSVNYYQLAGRGDNLWFGGRVDFGF